MSSRLIYTLLGFILPYHVMRLLFPSVREKEQKSTLLPPFEIVTSTASGEFKPISAARRYISGQRADSFAEQLKLLEQTCAQNSKAEKNIISPILDQFGGQIESDRSKLYAALEKLVEKAEKNNTASVFIEEKYTVSFSAVSLQSPGFVEWIVETFIQYPKITEHLVVEIPESVLLHHEEKIQRLAKGLQWVGAHLCITLSSGGPHRFSTFSRLPVYAVKLNASDVLAVQHNKATAEWVQSLKRILFSQGILLLMDQSEIKAESADPLISSTSVES